ncbi:MAG: hypothetical protein LBS39_03725, partial [Campylobacteraceae bacterium]|nr:hypothetical protein [Campylobacteraceae bacterium]
LFPYIISFSYIYLCTQFALLLALEPVGEYGIQALLSDLLPFTNPGILERRYRLENSLPLRAVIRSKKVL